MPKQAKLVMGATFIRPSVKVQESPRVSVTVNGVIASGPVCVKKSVALTEN